MENPDRVTYFAATDARGERVPFGIKQKDRSRHMYVIGKTGMGKSTLLENLAIQDIRNGEGLVFIDPHGGTAEKLLEYIPEERINDVVYFAPFDMDNPLAFNIMEDVGYDKRHLVVSGLMATFKKIWQDAWSARMEYILSNTLLALLEYPDATLLGVNRMYTDKAYRKVVVDNVKDPLVKDFWTKEFAGYTDRYTQEATPAIQNKIGQFTGNPLIRNIIGQPHSSFDIRQMMDKKKILIANLSKGLVGDTNMRLLGSMLTTRIFLAAMSRADVSAANMLKLPNFYFYVDEFQNFANETFAEILSEARKYKLNLTITNQYIEQMEEEVRSAVFGNVGTMVSFRVGPFDAEVLETIFMPEFTKEDIVNLGFAQVYLTLMIDGVGSRPFSAVTIAPIEPPPSTFKDKVIAASRKQFSNPRAGVEEAIMETLVSFGGKDTNDTRSKTRKNAPQRSRQKESSEVIRNSKNTGNYNRRVERDISAPQSSDDLKSILHSVAGVTRKAKVNIEIQKKVALKDTLTKVLQNTAPSKRQIHEVKERQVPRTKKQTPSHAQHSKLSTWNEKGVHSAMTTHSGTASGVPNSASNTREREDTQQPSKPFEVPEETLRKVFKGNA